MVDLLRIRSVHTGTAGSPYVSTFYFLSVPGLNTQTVNELVETFWAQARNGMASPWKVQNEDEVARLDSATGDVEATIGVSTIAQTAGGSTMEWTAKQGNLALRTAIFRNGRRVQGRLYLPCVAGGTGEQAPTDAYRAIGDNAASNLIDGAQALNTAWVVWSRPSAPGASDGLPAGVQSASVRNAWAVLRSRRD